MIITNCDDSLEDIFDVRDNLDTDDLESLLDSRLDVESVLIEDIKLETDMTVYCSDSQSSAEFGDVQQTSQQMSVLVDSESDQSDGVSPLQRDRCNTWPRLLESETATVPSQPSWHSPHSGAGLACVTEETEPHSLSQTEHVREGNSVYGRRNPWGNQSYADLITQAISSAGDRRMTLSQIYDWMVANIPYFTDRQSNSKSAGWKNSIRHNLSLHQKFVKIPNEGAGKSSWWTLNLDNNPVRKPRRRATSGDIKMLQNRRERVRSKADAFKQPEKLMRSYSSNGLPPLIPTPATNKQQQSSNGFDVSGAFSSFRSRNLSTASTTSQDSGCGFTMEELVTSEISGLSGSWLEDSPPQSSLEQVNNRPRIKILEPRDSRARNMGSQGPVEVTGEVTGEEERVMKMYEEERRMMILRQLEILTNKKIMENADVDHSIHLLQEQLEKMQGEQQSVSAEHVPNINEEHFVENLDFSPTYYEDLFKTNCEQNVNDEYNIF